MSGQKISTSTMDAAAHKTTSSDTTESRGLVTQNYLLIWLDGSIDQTKQNCQDTIAQLRNVVNDVNTFTQPDECVDFLTEVEDRTTFLVVSGTMSQQTVPLIHDIANLDSICIFCENEVQYKEWATEWPKI